MYINTTTNQYPISEQDIRNSNPNTSFSNPFNPPEEYQVVFPAPIPDYNPISQFIREISPELTILGSYEQRFEVVDLDAEQIAINEDNKAAEVTKRLADKYQSLWAAADTYVTKYISGVAIGILTIGVIQQKPKALAVTQWASSVWAEYYLRKALIAVDSLDDLDFSTLGAMPYSVPELQDELGL